MNAIEAIAEILKREGVEYLCCFPHTKIIEECAKLDIHVIVTRQERIAVAVADGFNRVTNGKRMAVFSSQHASGIENAFPGAAQAYADNSPLLLIPQGEPTDRTFSKPVFNALENFRHVTKWGARIDHVHRIPEIMRRAFYAMRNGKPGPVLVEVSNDLQFNNFGKLDYEPVSINPVHPHPEDVSKAAKILIEAENPFIHAGQGVLYAEASTELIQLAELLQSPVMTTLLGKSAFPEDHSLAVGSAATTNSKQLAHFLERADVIFGIGTSLSKTAFGKAIPAGKIHIHATNDHSDIHKDYTSDYPLPGDAKFILQALVEEVKAITDGKGRDDTRTVDELRKIKNEWLDEWMSELTSDESPVNQYRIVWELNNHPDKKNFIITHDSGSPREQLQTFYEATTPRSYIGWGRSTQLGFGLGAIMGAKLAVPEKTCINIMGDAAIGMVGMDIETAVRNKIPIITIVFNNGMMTTELPAFTLANKKYRAVEQGGNYAGVAEALGAWARRVERPDDFLPIFAQAMEINKQGQPALIEIIAKQNTSQSKY